MADAATVAHRLEHLRARKGMTLDGLSEASGVSADAIRRIELGLTARPRLGTLYRLVEALGEPIEELLGEREGAA